MGLTKLSHSSMKTFKQCPKKYYYRYIERAKTKEWRHLLLGNFCHTALELFHKKYMKSGAPHGLNKIMKSAFQAAKKEYDSLDNNTLLEAKEMLEDYLKMVKADGMPLVKEVERSFNINLGNDVLIRGFIDRVDIASDKRYHIVDYKTTKNEKYLDQDQLLVYGIWLLEEYPEIDEFKGSYVLLRHDSKYKSYDFNSYDVEKMKKKILECATSINGEEIWPTIPTGLCRYCDYCDICPAQGSW